MLKSERHALILSQLISQGSVSVTRLAASLNVDPVTIRRDLADLESAGQAQRVHGGAIARITAAPGPQDSLERRIAEAAARTIPDQSTVFLGPGTLTQEIVSFLSAYTHLTLITNALDVAWMVVRQPQHTLHLIGGQVGSDYGIYGEAETWRRVRADCVILQAGGLDAERGVTHDHREYAVMARALFGLVAQIVLLLPPDRLGRAAGVFIAPASEVDVLITGREAPTPALWDLSELGVRIVLT